MIIRSLLYNNFHYTEWAPRFSMVQKDKTETLQGGLNMTLNTEQIELIRQNHNVTALWRTLPESLKTFEKEINDKLKNNESGYYFIRLNHISCKDISADKNDNDLEIIMCQNGCDIIRCLLTSKKINEHLKSLILIPKPVVNLMILPWKNINKRDEFRLFIWNANLNMHMSKMVNGEF
eukprot:UN29822